MKDARYVLAVTILVLIPLYAKGATILTEDTTWSGNVVLTENVQIAEDVKLELLPGVTVYGDASPRPRIQVFGELSTSGTGGDVVLNNLYIETKGSSDDQSIYLQNSYILNSEVGSGGTYYKSDISIIESTLIQSSVDVRYTYNTDILRNIFIGGNLGPSRASQFKTVSGNLFYTTRNYTAIPVWGRTGNAVEIIGNNFYLIGENSRAISLTGVSGGDGTKLSENYISYGSVGEADAIFDKSDDLTAGGYVQELSRLEEPNREARLIEEMPRPEVLWDIYNRSVPGHLKDIIDVDAADLETGVSSFDDVVGTTSIDQVYLFTDFYGSAIRLTNIDILDISQVDGYWYVSTSYSSGDQFRINRLIDIDRISIGDNSIALDIAGNAGNVLKLLGAVFGAETAQDPAFVGIGIAYLDAGMSHSELMRLAIEARLGQNFTHYDVVSLLVTNILGLPISVSEAMPYVNLLDTMQLSVGDLGVIAAGVENNLVNVAFDEMSSKGVVFKPYTLE